MRAGHARPLQGGDGETGYGGKFRRGEGTPPYARVFKRGRRAASPLAAVAVCGGGKVCGRDESLPYGLNHKRDLAISCGPGMPGPYRAAMGKRDTAVSFGGVRAPRPTHGFSSGVVGRPVLWPPWPFAAAVSCGPGMPGPYKWPESWRQ